MPVMISREPIKNVLNRVGLYHPVRSLYRRFSPSIQRGVSQEVEFYRPLIREGGLCFDIGANVGKKVEVFLKLGTRVVAVDPNPYCEESLRWQFGKNPAVTIVTKAISDEVGTAKLHFGISSALASLRADWNVVGNGGLPIDVPTVTLDSLIADHGVPDLCKIDVEGHEPMVLRGLSRPIPCVTFEYFRHELDRTRDCLERLASLGPIECNVSSMHAEMRNYFPDWTDGATLLDRLSKEDGLDGGDVVVKTLAPVR